MIVRLFFILGCAFSFLAVALGAFAAHGLKAKLSVEMFNIFEVGVRYHFYHALALFVVAGASACWNQINFSLAGWLFVIGIILFSGSLYVLSLTETRWLGAITPLGGIAFLAGWILLAYKVFQN